MDRPTQEEFDAAARVWLDEHAERRDEDGDDEFVWGKGDFDVSVFHALSHADEQALIDRLQRWTQAKSERGYHAITASPDEGGLGLPNAYARDYARLERDYVLPPGHEVHSVTTRLVAPTIRVFGTPEQQAKFVPTFLAAGELCCQLFSEPGAGSDLATLACRAERDGDEWIVNGQKVWSSGAQFAQWGELIARTDPDVAKHAGLTAFIIPLDLPGMTVRPIKQMSGGASFNEVFFDDVRVPDSMRLGPIGSGWKVALTTLGFERDHSGTGGERPRRRLVAAAARHRTGDGRHRAIQSCASSLPAPTRSRSIEGFLNRRCRRPAPRRPAPPVRRARSASCCGPRGCASMSDAVSAVLGAKLIADTGEWGTYEWREHVLGAPGYRIAGGSDEMQRNIIGERVLGLPPRAARRQGRRVARRPPLNASRCHTELTD